ncbi:MAG: hypothetical protein SPI59_02335 [Finegoldia sp.]|nr:hypothetical protein [Finegoldia sp.]
MEERKREDRIRVDLDFPKEIEVRRLHKKKEKTDKKILTHFMKMIFVVTFLLSVLCLYRDSYISKLDSQIVSKNAEIENKEASRDKIYSDMGKDLNISKVEDVAKNSLGMIFPREDHIIYIDLED